MSDMMSDMASGTIQPVNVYSNALPVSRALECKLAFRHSGDEGACPLRQQGLVPHRANLKIENRLFAKERQLTLRQLRSFFPAFHGSSSSW